MKENIIKSAPTRFTERLSAIRSGISRVTSEIGRFCRRNGENIAATIASGLVLSVFGGFFTLMIRSGMPSVANKEMKLGATDGQTKVEVKAVMNGEAFRLGRVNATCEFANTGDASRDPVTALRAASVEVSFRNGTISQYSLTGMDNADAEKGKIVVKTDGDKEQPGVEAAMVGADLRNFRSNMTEFCANALSAANSYKSYYGVDILAHYVSVPQNSELELEGLIIDHKRNGRGKVIVLSPPPAKNEIETEVPAPRPSMVPTYLLHPDQPRQ